MKNVSSIPTRFKRITLLLFVIFFISLSCKKDKKLLFVEGFASATNTTWAFVDGTGNVEISQHMLKILAMGTGEGASEPLEVSSAKYNFNYNENSDGLIFIIRFIKSSVFKNPDGMKMPTNFCDIRLNNYTISANSNDGSGNYSDLNLANSTLYIDINWKKDKWIILKDDEDISDYYEVEKMNNSSSSIEFISGFFFDNPTGLYYGVDTKVESIVAYEY